MKFSFLKYLLFSLIFFYIIFWIHIKLLLPSIGQNKTSVTIIKDPKIQQLILNKTGINIPTIKISETDHPFGMMVGIPTKPQLILARGMIDTFSDSEIEYVVLHEAGHYVLGHSVKEFIVGIILLVLGIIILRKIKVSPKAIIFSIFLGFIFGVLMIQIGKINELQADNFTVKRMTDLNGMISATNKFRNNSVKQYTQSKSPIVQLLFYRGNPYDNRIKMAQEEIKLRSK